MERYSRHIILGDVGKEGQQKLNQAKVLVVGAGGLGCPALQYLVAAGIGTIGIIDHDVVEESNLQRQVLFGTSSLGKNKAIAAKRRLEDLNPDIEIVDYPYMLEPKNAVELFSKYDIILDGSDNFSTRYLVNDSALLTNKPFVYGAIYKFEGQVAVFNYKNGPSYRCLFPNPPDEGSVANCSEVGVLGVLSGIIGTMMANEVIKIILNFEHVLKGKLLCYNSKTSETFSVKINKKPEEFDKVLNRKSLLESYSNSCVAVKEISETELKTLSEVQFIDIRELNEQPKLELPNCIQIPLSEFEKSTYKIDNSQSIVVFCQSGIRSKKAVQILSQQGIYNTYSYKGGIIPLLRTLKTKSI